MKYEEVYNYIGHFGVYQACIVACACVMSIYDSEMMTMVFVGGEMDHWCRVPQLANLSFAKQKDIAIPHESDAYSRCEMYDRDYSSFTEERLSNWNRSEEMGNGTILGVRRCDGYVYDRSRYSSTIVNKFGLVCQYEFLNPLVSAVYMAGGLLGSLLSGAISDRIGRKVTLTVFLMLRISSAAVFIFAPFYWVFLAGRFLLGVSGNAVRVTSYVLVMELVGSRYRPQTNTALIGFISSGAVIMAAMASVIRDDFRYQLTVFAPMIFFMVYAIYVMPESPRWLQVQGRYDEVNAIWRHISEVNYSTLPADFDSRNIDKTEIQANGAGKCSDIVTSSTMLIRSIVIGFVMFSGSLVYYAIALNINSLPGNIYINSCVSGAVEVPGQLLGLYLCNYCRYTRRRLTITGGMTLAGVGLTICIPLILLGFESGTTAATLLSKTFLCTAMSVTFLYAAELFPTQVRNAALGVLLMSARLGSMIAPYMGKSLIDIWKPLPSAIFGVLSIASGLLCMLLPETYGQQVCDTVKEAETLARKKKNEDNKSSHRSSVNGLSVIEINLAPINVDVGTGIPGDHQTSSTSDANGTTSSMCVL